MANQGSAQNTSTPTNRNIGSDKKPIELDKNKLGSKKEMSSEEQTESDDDSEEGNKWNNVSQLDKDKKVPQQPAR